MQQEFAGTIRTGGPALRRFSNYANGLESSLANFEALASLRVRYQSRASSYSALASSRNSRDLAAMSKFGRNPVTDLFPGNGLCFAGIEVRDAARDFFVPGSFDGFGIVMDAIQTLQQRTRQFGAFFRAKGEGALQ